MKKLFIPAFLLCFCLFAAPAHAAGKVGGAMNLDMNTVTCKDYLEMFNAATPEDQAAATMILFWLDGFASATSGNHVIDSKIMETDMKDVIEACTAAPSKKLMDLYTE